MLNPFLLSGESYTEGRAGWGCGPFLSTKKNIHSPVLLIDLDHRAKVARKRISTSDPQPIEHDPSTTADQN
jgi:hypothetical protein